MSKLKTNAAVPVAKPVSKKTSLYNERLEAAGLPPNPIVSEPKPIRQFQLAHLAATLAGGAGGEVGASELTVRALQLWNAAGKTLVTSAQAEVLAKGLLVMDRKDWEMHAETLIASMDNLHGAVPGYNPNDLVKESRQMARGKAGLAVSQAWKIGPDSDDTLKLLFSGKAETVETRKQKFYELVAYAATAAENTDEVYLHAKDGNKLKSSILSAWAPLGEPDDKAMDMALVLLEVFQKKYVQTILCHLYFH